MKLGDKFRPNAQFFDKYECHLLKKMVREGLALSVECMPSRSGKFKYGFSVNYISYGFDDVDVIPVRPRQLENK